MSFGRLCAPYSASWPKPAMRRGEEEGETMPAHIQPLTDLRVTFWRCGLERDNQVAPTPERALKAAIVMLASLDDLIDGDKLTVTVPKNQISALLIMATLAVLPA